MPGSPGQAAPAGFFGLGSRGLQAVGSRSSSGVPGFRDTPILRSTLEVERRGWMGGGFRFARSLDLRSMWLERNRSSRTAGRAGSSLPGILPIGRPSSTAPRLRGRLPRTAHTWRRSPDASAELRRAPGELETASSLPVAPRGSANGSLPHLRAPCPTPSAAARPPRRWRQPIRRSVVGTARATHASSKAEDRAPGFRGWRTGLEHRLRAGRGLLP